MTMNIGTLDTIMRLLLAAGIAILYFTQFRGTSVIVTLIRILTDLIRFWILDSRVEVATCKK